MAMYNMTEIDFINNYIIGVTNFGCEIHLWGIIYNVCYTTPEICV